jgi:hypothetical protein
MPATDDHVRRLTVQRRIFRIDGRPHLVVRGGYNETHATLAALLERHRAGAPHRPAEPGAAAVMVQAAPPDTSTPAAAPERHGAEQRHEAAESPAKKVRRPRQPRPSPEARQEATSIGAPEAEPSEAEAMLAEVTAAASSGGPKARVVGPWRAGQPKTPRWMVAGKLRRGRLR